MTQPVGYICDGCGKSSGYTFMDRTPNNWYSMTLWNSWVSNYHFCSKECLAKWAGTEPIPESRMRLLQRFVKGA